MKHTLLRIASVVSRTGMSKSSIYVLVSGDGFPKPVKLRGTANAWVEAEVDEWINGRIAERDAGGPAFDDLVARKVSLIRGLHNVLADLAKHPEYYAGEQGMRLADDGLWDLICRSWPHLWGEPANVAILRRAAGDGTAGV